MAILIKSQNPYNKKEIVVASAYFPGEESEPPPNNIRNLIEFCSQENLELIIGCDANAHHPTWGSSNTNARGEALLQ